VNGDPKGSSNGEPVLGIDRLIELSVDSIDSPDNCAAEADVTVAAQSQVTNLPLCCGWSFQELEYTSLC